jgi:threonine dehydratase/uncharacterized membrane protein YcfT
MIRIPRRWREIPAPAVVAEPASAPDSVQGRARTQWADVAKGICILLVVLWHVVVKHYLQIDWHLSLPIPGAWGALGEQLLPLRMPLFFTISGMFAVRAVHRHWRVLARAKLAKYLYLYATWLLIHTAVLALVPGFHTDRARGVLDLVEQLTITPSNLWYLYALALYFAIAKAVRSLPPVPVLAVALALSAAAGAGLLDTPGNRAGVYQNLVFFLAGLYLQPWVERCAATANGRRLAITGALYAVALATMSAVGAQRWFGVWPAISVLATVFGVTAAAMLCRWTALAGALAWLGRRTLPIYVIHMPVLALLHLLLVDRLSQLGSTAQLVLAVGYPIVLTAVVAGLSLAIHRVLLAAGARWLFELPGRTRRTTLHTRSAAGRPGRQALEETLMNSTESCERLVANALPTAPLTTILDWSEVDAAARWLSTRIVRTPVVRSPVIDRIAGARILLKAENLQLSGSYKARGAFRAVSRIAAAGRHDGVIAQSTGNHALAVALAAREYGLQATVVLPIDASPVKVTKAEGFGARVVLAGTTVDERLAVVDELRWATGHAVVDAYDHRDVVAGQGSASLELIEQADRLDTPLTALVLPVGGGGGVAGACLAARGRDIAVYGVEPVGCDSLAQSLAAGRRVTVPPAATLADGLRPSLVGALPFAIARDALAGVVLVDDDAIAEALCLALFHAKLLVEPSAAAGLAGALRVAADHPEHTVGVVLTGGNVEPELVARLVSQYSTQTLEGTAS